MKKFILILFIIIIFNTLLSATDPLFVSVGLSNTLGGGGDGTISAGKTVYVKAVGNGLGGVLQPGIHDNGSSQNNKLYVYYYKDLPPVTFKTFAELDATNFSVSNDTLTFQFVMPAENSNTIYSYSIEIYFGLIGINGGTNYGDAKLSYTGVNNAPGGYIPFLEYYPRFIINNIGTYIETINGQLGTKTQIGHTRIDYTALGMNAVQGIYFDSVDDDISVTTYDADIPLVSGYIITNHVGTSNWVGGGVGENKIATFDFIIPSGLSSSPESFQLGLGLYGLNADAESYDNKEVSSYITQLPFLACPGDPPAGYYEYIDYEDPTIELNFGSVNKFIFIDTTTDWENIILTYDKSDIKIYLDNVYQGMVYIGDISSNYSTEGLYIGGRNNNSVFQNGFIGSEDEVAIFKKVLTVEDRAIIIGGGTMKTVGDCRTISGLKAYWRFEEKAGTAVLDWAGQ